MEENVTEAVVDVKSPSKTAAAIIIINDLNNNNNNNNNEEEEENACCSICLDPFTPPNPPSVTNCKHEYHLQCILEWSQRRTECPICWQNLILTDPVSQELLVAVENERILRSKRSAQRVQIDYGVNHDATQYEEGSDFESRIMRHFAAAARRARFVGRRGREISPNDTHSQVLYSVPQSDVHQIHVSPEHERSRDESSDRESFSTIHAQNSASTIPEVINEEPLSVGNCTKPSQTESPRRSSSDFSAFSDSFKSKFSAASFRYKESISKGTRGFKDKLLARNISVKELGKGVQREMNAGIAGVTRIIERLDLASKTNGVSAHLSSCTRGTSNVSSEIDYEGDNVEEHAYAVDSAASSRVQSNISAKSGSSTC